MMPPLDRSQHAPLMFENFEPEHVGYLCKMTHPQRNNTLDLEMR